MRFMGNQRCERRATAEPMMNSSSQEGDRILKAFGNHPSFCMMAYGNEPLAKNRMYISGSLLHIGRQKIAGDCIHQRRLADPSGE